MLPKGLFVGLITLDLIYHVDQIPGSNQKIVACDQILAAGGPATNAAVAFQHLDHPAQIVGILGAHPLQQLIRSDLSQLGISILDLQPQAAEPPPLSSILVTVATGDRAVVSRNAIKRQANPDQIPANVLQDVEIVLIDGHQMAVSSAIAQQAKAQGIPVVIDGGSWKPGFETVLPWADSVIASANFYPPGCSTPADVFDYLAGLGVSHLAITQGSQPILYRSGDRVGSLPVPEVQAVDTLGAGDIFHGAFCHFILDRPFVEALTAAAEVAAQACQYFGTRQWLHA